MRSSTPSYTIKIVFPSNSFSRSRHSKSNWYHTISVDLFPSGDLLQGVLKMHYFPVVFFCGAGGLLFLCLGGACLINGLHSLGLCCTKNWIIRGRTAVATRVGIPRNQVQNYIKLKIRLVNNFNNFNNIWNVLHICMEKNATISVGSRFKAIILIIIFYWHWNLTPETIGPLNP